MKKLVLSMVSVIAMAMLLTACGGEKVSKELPESKIEVSKDEPSWKKDDSEAELEWYINFDWFAQVWGEDTSTKYITEDTNVKVKYLGGDDDRLNTMLASGDLPDLITIAGNNPLIKEASKFALPLEELAEKYDPYFLEHAAKPDVLNFMTQDDGHIYGYPNFSTTTADYEEGGVYGDQGFLVRKDIYDKLGQPDMSTPESFLKALDEAKELNEKDAMGRDIIPFGMPDFIENSEKFGVFETTLADYIGVPMITEDNKLYDRYFDEDFQTWVKTINKARQSGLTDPDMITMTKDDKDSKLSTGGYFVYFASNIIGETDPLSLLASENPEFEYFAIEGPKSTIGRDRALTANSIEGWTQTFITKTTKDPQKAMELMTYLVSEEGNMVMNFGREGETYEMVDGLPKMNQDLLEFKQSDPAGFEKKEGLTTHLWLQDSVELSRQMGIDQFPKALQQAKLWTQEHIVPKFEIAQIDSSLSKESMRNKEKIRQDWGQTVTKILNAKDDKEIEGAFEAHKAYRDENGYDKIVEESNKKISENIEKLK